MSEILPITHARLRAWYELSFDARRATIILRVHRNFIKNCQLKATSESPVVKLYMEQFGFDQFDGSLAKDFGFDRSFRFIRRCQDGFNEFAAKLPRVYRLTDKACPECGGGGKDRAQFDFQCFECHGTGKEHKLDRQEAFALSASLTVFTNLAAWPEWGEAPEPPPSRLQLLTFGTITENHSQGGSLWGMYSIPLVKYLSWFPAGSELKFVENAMVVAFDRMLGLRPYRKQDFFASIADNKGWLNIGCPGDACELHPADHFRSGLTEGYDFTCHNVDTPMQQLTLVAGLAALHDLARKEIGLKNPEGGDRWMQ